MFRFGTGQELTDILGQLISKYNTVSSPEDKIKIAVDISSKFLGIDNDSALFYAANALQLCDKINNDNLRGFSTKALSEAYHFTGQKKLRDSLINLSINYFKQSNDLKGEAAAVFRKANHFKDDGSYKEAAELFYESVNLSRKVKAESTEAWAQISTGELMYNMGKPREAISYSFLGLEIMKKINNEDGISFACSNLGIYYDAAGNSDSALYYYSIGAEYIKKLKKLNRLADTYSNMGVLYFYRKDFYKAIKLFQMALDVNKDIDYPDNKGSILINLGEVYMEQKLYAQSEKYLMEGLTIFKTLNSHIFLREAYRILSDLHSRMGKYKDAYEDHKIYHALNDSILSSDNNKALTEMTIKYDTDAKKKTIALLSSQKLLKDAEIKKQRFFIFGGIVVLLIILVFSVLLYNRFKLTKKQKSIIEAQKHIVDEKQKEIIDSIHYAKRIQQALLPSEKYLEKTFINLKKHKK